MIQKSYDNSPTLYLVPTPIGNMDDLTYRAVKVLNDVDAIFCEDTRETGLLLKYLNIKKKMISNHKYNETKNYDRIINYLEKGKSIALVSDRGTPVISDPGYEVACYVIKKGYNVVALPGATALIPALITSGITPMPFLFYGFLNSKKSQRLKELENLKNIQYTLIFYEAPHRILDTLNDMKNILGNKRKISISREITKKYEEIQRGVIDDVLKGQLETRGEYVIVVSGNEKIEDYQNISIMDHINLYLQDNFSSMEAIKKVAKDRKIKKSEVYNIYLQNKGDQK